VRKHALASRVRLQLHYGDKDIRIIIQDDGIGFSVPQPLTCQTARGYGLVGMMERARLVDGTLKVTSEEGKGTQVEVRVPFLTIKKACKTNGLLEGV